MELQAFFVFLFLIALLYSFYLDLRVSEEAEFLCTHLVFGAGIFLLLYPKLEELEKITNISSLSKWFIILSLTIAWTVALIYRIKKFKQTQTKPKCIPEFIIVTIFLFSPAILIFKNPILAFIIFGVVYVIVMIVSVFLNYYEKKKKMSTRY